MDTDGWNVEGKIDPPPNMFCAMIPASLNASLFNNIVCLGLGSAEKV